MPVRCATPSRISVRISSNLEIDLSKYFTEDENSLYQGKTLAVPEELDIMALAYNKDLFDEAGVAYPTEYLELGRSA